MKTNHYPNKITFHSVTIVPMTSFTLKSTSKLRSFLHFRYSIVVVSLTEIITNVDEVDLIMFNSISKSNTKSNKNNLDVVQLAASVRMTCIQ